jgi:hypothetical protein
VYLLGIFKVINDIPKETIFASYITDVKIFISDKIMLRLLPSFARLLTRRSPFLINRFSSQSSNSSDEPRVRLHPGNQYTVEEIAQGIPEQRKRDIEQLYEFEKLEINNQPSTRDEYRHNVTRLFTSFFLSIYKQ